MQQQPQHALGGFFRKSFGEAAGLSTARSEGLVSVGGDMVAHLEKALNRNVERGLGLSPSAGAGSLLQRQHQQQNRYLHQGQLQQEQQYKQPFELQSPPAYPPRPQQQPFQQAYAQQQQSLLRYGHGAASAPNVLMAAGLAIGSSTSDPQTAAASSSTGFALAPFYPSHDSMSAGDPSSVHNTRSGNRSSGSPATSTLQQTSSAQNSGNSSSADSSNGVSGSASSSSGRVSSGVLSLSQSFQPLNPAPLASGGNNATAVAMSSGTASDGYGMPAAPAPCPRPQQPQLCQPPVSASLASSTYCGSVNSYGDSPTVDLPLQPSYADSEAPQFVRIYGAGGSVTGGGTAPSSHHSVGSTPTTPPFHSRSADSSTHGHGYGPRKRRREHQHHHYHGSVGDGSASRSGSFASHEHTSGVSSYPTSRNYNRQHHTNTQDRMEGASGTDSRHSGSSSDSSPAAPRPDLNASTRASPSGQPAGSANVEAGATTVVVVKSHMHSHASSSVTGSSSSSSGSVARAQQAAASVAQLRLGSSSAPDGRHTPAANPSPAGSSIGDGMESLRLSQLGRDYAPLPPVASAAGINVSSRIAGAGNSLQHLLDVDDMRRQQQRRHQHMTNSNAASTNNLATGVVGGSGGGPAGGMGGSAGGGSGGMTSDSVSSRGISDSTPIYSTHSSSTNTTSAGLAGGLSGHSLSGHATGVGLSGSGRSGATGSGSSDGDSSQPASVNYPHHRHYHHTHHHHHRHNSARQHDTAGTTHDHQSSSADGSVHGTGATAAGPGQNTDFSGTPDSGGAADVSGGMMTNSSSDTTNTTSGSGSSSCGERGSQNSNNTSSSNERPDHGTSSGYRYRKDSSLSQPMPSSRSPHTGHTSLTSLHTHGTERSSSSSDTTCGTASSPASMSGSGRPQFVTGRSTGDGGGGSGSTGSNSTTPPMEPSPDHGPASSAAAAAKASAKQQQQQQSQTGEPAVPLAPQSMPFSAAGADVSSRQSTARSRTGGTVSGDGSYEPLSYERSRSNTVSSHHTVTITSSMGGGRGRNSIVNQQSTMILALLPQSEAIARPLPTEGITSVPDGTLQPVVQMGSSIATVPAAVAGASPSPHLPSSDPPRPVVPPIQIPSVSLSTTTHRHQHRRGGNSDSSASGSDVGGSRKGVSGQGLSAGGHNSHRPDAYHHASYHHHHKQQQHHASSGPQPSTAAAAPMALLSNGGSPVLVPSSEAGGAMSSGHAVLLQSGADSLPSKQMWLSPSAIKSLETPLLKGMSAGHQHHHVRQMDLHHNHPSPLAGEEVVAVAGHGLALSPGSGGVLSPGSGSVTLASTATTVQTSSTVTLSPGANASSTSGSRQYQGGGLSSRGTAYSTTPLAFGNTQYVSGSSSSSGSSSFTLPGTGHSGNSGSYEGHNHYQHRGLMSHLTVHQSEASEAASSPDNAASLAAGIQSPQPATGSDTGAAVSAASPAAFGQVPPDYGAYSLWMAASQPAAFAAADRPLLVPPPIILPSDPVAPATAVSNAPQPAQLLQLQQQQRHAGLMAGGQDVPFSQEKSTDSLSVPYPSLSPTEGGPISSQMSSSTADKFVAWQGLSPASHSSGNSVMVVEGRHHAGAYAHATAVAAAAVSTGIPSLQQLQQQMRPHPALFAPSRGSLMLTRSTDTMSVVSPLAGVELLRTNSTASHVTTGQYLSGGIASHLSGSAGYGAPLSPSPGPLMQVGPLHHHHSGATVAAAAAAASLQQVQPMQYANPLQFTQQMSSGGIEGVAAPWAVPLPSSSLELNSAAAPASVPPTVGTHNPALFSMSLSTSVQSGMYDGPGLGSTEIPHAAAAAAIAYGATYGRALSGQQHSISGGQQQMPHHTAPSAGAGIASSSYVSLHQQPPYAGHYRGGSGPGSRSSSAGAGGRGGPQQQHLYASGGSGAGSSSGHHGVPVGLGQQQRVFSTMATHVSAVSAVSSASEGRTASVSHQHSMSQRQHSASPGASSSPSSPRGSDEHSPCSTSHDTSAAGDEQDSSASLPYTALLVAATSAVGSLRSPALAPNCRGDGSPIREGIAIMVSSPDDGGRTATTASAASAASAVSIASAASGRRSIGGGSDVTGETSDKEREGSDQEHTFEDSSQMGRPVSRMFLGGRGPARIDPEAAQKYADFIAGAGSGSGSSRGGHSNRSSGSGHLGGRDRVSGPVLPIPAQLASSKALLAGVDGYMGDDVSTDVSGMSTPRNYPAHGDIASVSSGSGTLMSHATPAGGLVDASSALMQHHHQGGPVDISADSSPISSTSPSPAAAYRGWHHLQTLQQQQQLHTPRLSSPNVALALGFRDSRGHRPPLHSPTDHGRHSPQGSSTASTPQRPLVPSTLNPSGTAAAAVGFPSGVGGSGGSPNQLTAWPVGLSPFGGLEASTYYPQHQQLQYPQL